MGGISFFFLESEKSSFVFVIELGGRRGFEMKPGRNKMATVVCLLQKKWFSNNIWEGKSCEKKHLANGRKKRGKNMLKNERKIEHENTQI